MSHNHIAWPEIESFHNIRKYTQSHPEICESCTQTVYKGKIKLHGSNAAIQILRSGEVIPQSRTTVLTPESDNAGFAKWVKNSEDIWKKVAFTHQDIVVFGEWCGPGIQKGVAVSQIPNRAFAIFAIYLVSSDTMMVDPESIKALIGDSIPDTYVLPWATDSIVVDWAASADELSPIVDKINGWVFEVEKCDPWVKEIFGVEGLGEGLVFYPRPVTSREYYVNTSKEYFSNLVFKAKGEKHKVVAAKAPAQIDPEVAANADAFAKLVLTEARLEQGVGVVGLDMKNTGKFLDWTIKDVMKETNDELAASNLTWPQVQKPISEMARKWFINRCKQL